MQVKVNIEFNQLLKIVRALPSGQLRQLKGEIEKEAADALSVVGNGVAGLSVINAYGSFSSSPTSAGSTITFAGALYSTLFSVGATIATDNPYTAFIAGFALSNTSQAAGNWANSPGANGYLNYVIAPSAGIYSYNWNYEE